MPDNYPPTVESATLLEYSPVGNPRRHIENLLEHHHNDDNTQDKQQWLNALGESLSKLHEADIADLLESLPIGYRALVWGAIDQNRLGNVLLEVSQPLCENLVELTPTEIMIGLLQQLNGDEVATLMRQLSISDAARLMRLAGLADNRATRASLSFANHTVGALMDYQPVFAREDENIGAIRDRLQQIKQLPSHCDKLFVVDDWERLAGILTLKQLLLNPANKIAADAMITESLHTFDSDDDIEFVTSAFERYDLISAPVLDHKHKVIGRITINELFDELHNKRSRGLINSAGVSEEEDLFASIGKRFGNRWRWLFINLIAAFFISRVVGLFEATIIQLVALASLMPIVAGMSGNIGNQTATLTIRALALNQINKRNRFSILRNEILLSIVNGLVWGSIVSAFAYLLYNRIDLALVMTLSMTLCFLFGASAGFIIPIMMQRLGRDPALGTTVVISAITDTLGFLIFLGMGALLI